MAVLLIVHNCIYINYIIHFSQDRERVHMGSSGGCRPGGLLHSMTAQVSLQPRGNTGEFLMEVNQNVLNYEAENTSCDFSVCQLAE